MKKFYLLTKTLLVAVCLLVGASNAWGQTTVFSQDFTKDEDGGTSTDPTKYGFTLSTNEYVTYTVTGGVLQCVYGNYQGAQKYGDAIAIFDEVSNDYVVTLSYTWVLGNATGNKTQSYTSTRIGNSSGNALVINFQGSYDTNGHITVNGTEIHSGTALRGTTYTITATLNLKTKKITALNMTCSNATYSYTATEDIAFESNITSIDRFIFRNSQRQNWENTSSVDNISIGCQPIADGDYYLKNKDTGAYFAVGASWGTQAISNMQGHRVGFAVQTGGKYHLNTYIYHNNTTSNTNHYLKEDFCDGATQEWTVTPDGEGYYTLNNATGKLQGNAVGSALTVTDGTGDNTKWKILTAAEWKSDNELRMESATANNGVDATFYITAANFGYADLDDCALWQGSPTFGGWDNKTSGRYWNAEKYTDPYATFDVYQALTGLKPGAYKLTVQGFYRNGENNESDANDNLAKLYANSVSVPLKNINFYQYENTDHSEEGFTTEKSEYYVPNSQADAAKAFNAGYYDNELYVVVGEDGALRLGVKKDAATGPNKDWACFDNFQLTYYGTSVTASIGAYGYATFSSAYDLDFTTPVEGLTAYKASSCDGTTVTLVEVDGKVKAGDGLVIKGTAGSYSIPVTTGASTIYTTPGTITMWGNTGTVAETVSKAVSGTNYVLSVEDEKVVFAPIDDVSATLNPGQAALWANIGSGGARGMILEFADEKITGINEAEAADATEAVQKEGKFVVDGKLVIFKKGMKFNANGQLVK